MRLRCSLVLILLALTITACTPQAAATPAATQPALEAEPTTAPADPTPMPPAPTAVPGAPASPEAPSPEAPASPEAPTPAQDGWQTYTNPEFGISFQFPSGWQGPDQYVSGSSLRLEIGSDVVYPYGTGPEERVYNLKDSYYVLIQYTKNNINDYWKESYDAVTALQDGQASSGRRDLLIRVGEVTVGRFRGLEYISTLSESAQTEPVYARNVILMDDQSNLLTIMGQPNNVAVGAGGWREAYAAIDAANAETFHSIVESLVIE